MLEKTTVKPGTMLNPVPVVLVSCGNGDKINLVTIAWTGIVNSNPPMVYISLRKSRYSHELISKYREFVINLVNENLTKSTDFCGVKSGRDINKFEACNLTPVLGKKIKTPLVEESPVNLECVVKDILEYPSHDMFIAEIVAVNANENLFDKKGRIRLDRAGLIAYNHGEYFKISSKPLGKFGYSIMKPKTKRRLAKENKKYTIKKRR